MVNIKCPNKKSEQYKELLEIANDNDLLASYMWRTLEYLKDGGFITKTRMKLYSGKYAYTIPKIITERSLTKKPSGWDKNLSKKQQLDKLLEEANINWIDVDETKNAYLLKINEPTIKQTLPVEEQFNLAEEVEVMSNLMFEENYTYFSEDEPYTAIKQNKPVSNIKPGVAELFDANPELAKIGTQEQYSQYLDTIFPDSKVKDIVYHGADEKIENFTLDKKKNKKERGLFFFSKKSSAQLWRDASFEETNTQQGDLIYALLNIKNPEIIDFENKSAWDMAKYANENIKGDGLIATNVDEMYVGRDTQYAAFKPEQIHILGSKQDIEGFKEFVKGPIKQQGQLSLFTEENFNQKFPNFAELQPFEKKIINDNKDEDLDIQCKL